MSTLESAWPPSADSTVPKASSLAALVCILPQNWTESSAVRNPVAGSAVERTAPVCAASARIPRTPSGTVHSSHCSQSLIGMQ